MHIYIYYKCVYVKNKNQFISNFKQNKQIKKQMEISPSLILESPY